ncbi:ABC transporter permease [Propioniciclava sp. MC1595]|uniref:DUF6297 family protein n=1 Tax=Propioniciclava sp. MC1595 TaxID=2760308 RepID=UPI0016622CC2|nr:DUF6297 family protein [Propioniciclava sp. MC1595]MBB1493978.1 ABC transporter permease [Propioniciclava sp. MC1595]QTE25359.1 ABC transporter permease [Propioniciclava sp. MC1595]
MARARRKGAKQQHQPEPQVVAPQPVVVPTDPYAEYADREWDFAWLPEEEPEVVDERALHALVKSWRHGRATRSILDVLQDAYIAIFSVAMIGAMVINVIVGSQTQSASCDTAACLNGRLLVPWGTFFAIAALAVSTARLFGPVLASAAEGFWLMEAPIGRKRILRGRLWAVVLGALVVAGLVSAGIAGIAGEPLWVVGAWAAASGLVASGLVAWSAWEQSFERVKALRVAQAVLAALAAVVLGTMVAVAAGWLHIEPPAWVRVVPWALAGLGLLMTVFFTVGAHRRLDRFARTRLTSGGSLVSGLQGAMFGLDLGLARDILVDREAIERGHVKPVPGRGLGAQALVWRDVQRLKRFPRPLIGLAGAVLAPYASDAIGLALLTPLLSAVALMFALVPTLGALRVLSRSSGLARALPFTTAQLRTATFAVPAVLALVWSLATIPAFLGVTGGLQRSPLAAVTVALACGVAGLAAAIRWQTAKPVNFAVPMMATGAGAVPPTLVFNLLRGFDVAALVSAPVLLNADPIWSLAIGVVVLVILRTGFNLEEMSEQAKEQQKLLDAEKAARAR